MTNITNTIIAAALAAFTAAPAGAIEFDRYSQHGAWIVDVEIYDGGSLACAAWTENRDGFRLDLTITDERQPQLYLITELPEGYSSQLYFDVTIPGVGDWDVGPLQFGSSGGFMNFEDPMTAIDLMQDLRDGTVVHFLSNRGTRPISFSLRGSSAAIADLWECAQRIGGEAM